MHNNYWFSKDIRNKYSLDPDQVRILLEVFLENNFIFWQFSIKPECADFDVKEFCSAKLNGPGGRIKFNIQVWNARTNFGLRFE